MATTLTESYDRTLAELFRAAGYGRSERGIYMQSDHGIVWRGLWITFGIKGGRLIVQPNLGVFCPAAWTLAHEGLSQLYAEVGRQRRPKLGAPLVTLPLYDRVRRQCGEDRMPDSYDVESFVEIDPAVQLIYEDFLKVANKFFGHISSIENLRDHIVAHPFSTAAGIHAMTLSYLLDKKISDQQIDEFCRLSPSPMTKQFAEHFKIKVATA
jgi:hypothetical protein